jgi:hypothetical protein
LRNFWGPERQLVHQPGDSEDRLHVFVSGHERDPLAALGHRRLGQDAQARGIDELEPAQVDHDRLGVAGHREAERLLELGRPCDVEVAAWEHP